MWFWGNMVKLGFMFWGKFMKLMQFDLVKRINRCTTKFKLCNFRVTAWNFKKIWLPCEKPNISGLPHGIFLFYLVKIAHINSTYQSSNVNNSYYWLFINNPTMGVQTRILDRFGSENPNIRFFVHLKMWSGSDSD